MTGFTKLIFHIELKAGINHSRMFIAMVVIHSYLDSEIMFLYFFILHLNIIIPLSSGGSRGGATGAPPPKI